MKELGDPVMDTVLTVDAVRKGGLDLGTIRPLLSGVVDQEKRVEVIVWEARCRSQVTDRAVAIVDPDDGSVLSVGEQRLFHSSHVMAR